MLIEKADIKDLDEIFNIEKICFPKDEAATYEQLKKRISIFKNHFFVLKKDNKIIGFINGMVTNDENLSDCMYSNANLHNENGLWQMVFGIDILPDYQKNGYAGMLMRHLIEVSKTEKRKGVVLTCKKQLIPFYEHFGFVCEGISSSNHGGVMWYQMRLLFND